MLKVPLSLFFSSIAVGSSVGIVNKGFNVLLCSEIDRIFLKYQQDLPFFPAVDGSYWTRQHRQWTQISPPAEDLMMKERLFFQEVFKSTFTVRCWQTVIVGVTAAALSILLAPEITTSSSNHRLIYAFSSAFASVLAIFGTTDCNL